MNTVTRYVSTVFVLHLYFLVCSTTIVQLVAIFFVFEDRETGDNRIHY